MSARLSLFYAIYALFAFSLTAASLGYFLLAASWWGKWAAIWGLALAFWPAALLWGSGRAVASPAGRFVFMVVTLLVVSIPAAMLWMTPSGSPPPGSPVSHRFTTAAKFRRFTLTNIVPEIEQINLGFLVMPYLDRLFTREQERRVSVFTLDLYREMENDPDFHELGSAMGWAYSGLLGRPNSVGHYYLYIPANRPSGPLPAIVFLHGSAGNFKAYTWIWSKLAEERGLVIIAPSFGFGFWNAPGGVEAIERAVEDAKTMVEIDTERVYLAGLSNGGLGVSTAAAKTPEMFRGLIFLSPVMPVHIVDGQHFQEMWKGRPVLVMTGEADERIPVQYVSERVQEMKRGGIEVTYRIYPGEDHFLVFSQWEQILKDVAEWLPE